MRVLVVHNLARGGARRRLGEQVARLDAEVIELALETATPVTDSPVLVPFAPHAPAVHRGLRPPLRYTDALRLTHAWRRLSNKAQSLGADVVFANPCQFLQAPPMLLSSRLPTVYFCDETRRVDHEPLAAATRNARTRALYAPLYGYERRLDTASARSATTVAANSHYSARCLQSAYGVEATVVPLGVAEVFRHGPLDGAREDVVLSVGMLTVFKGHDLVIRAAARSRRLRHVVIVSPRSDPPQEDGLRRLAGELGVSLDVRIGISDEELRHEYARARVTAYLARAEPFGLAALEAQACGCAVVTSAEGGLCEAIVDGVTGFAVPRDPAAAAVAFDALCDPETAARIASAAASHGRSWSWEVSAARVQGLLEEAIEVR